MLEVGMSAPLEQVVVDQHNQRQCLGDYVGQVVVVYFYPKDDTPGCTTQACGLRDSWEAFVERGVKVVGVSPDNAVKHQKFIGKYDLPFTLLCDEDHALSEAFGVWAEKRMYGRTYMGVLRTTFVLDETGVIVRIYPNVKPADHAAMVLRDLGA